MQFQGDNSFGLLLAAEEQTLPKHGLFLNLNVKCYKPTIFKFLNHATLG